LDLLAVVCASRPNQSLLPNSATSTLKPSALANTSRATLAAVAGSSPRHKTLIASAKMKTIDANHFAIVDLLSSVGDSSSSSARHHQGQLGDTRDAQHQCDAEGDRCQQEHEIDSSFSSRRKTEIDRARHMPGTSRRARGAQRQLRRGAADRARPQGSVSTKAAKGPPFAARRAA
jgi:hypothetical protein